MKVEILLDMREYEDLVLALGIATCACISNHQQSLSTRFIIVADMLRKNQTFIQSEKYEEAHG